MPFWLVSPSSSAALRVHRYRVRPLASATVASRPVALRKAGMSRSTNCDCSATVPVLITSFFLVASAIGTPAVK